MEGICGQEWTMWLLKRASFWVTLTFVLVACALWSGGHASVISR